MIIGERVKEARINKNYTQEELGDIIGVSKVSICGYETGNRTPTMAMVLSAVRPMSPPMPLNMHPAGKATYHIPTPITCFAPCSNMHPASTSMDGLSQHRSSAAMLPRV